MDAVTDHEITKAAKLAISTYGASAEDHASIMISRYEALGDALEGVAVWQRIRAAITALQPSKPASLTNQAATVAAPTPQPSAKQAPKPKAELKLTKSGHVKWW